MKFSIQEVQSKLNFIYQYNVEETDENKEFSGEFQRLVKSHRKEQAEQCLGFTQSACSRQPDGKPPIHEHEVEYLDGYCLSRKEAR